MSVDVELQFVDTNVAVYAYDETAGDRHQRARQLLDELWLNGSGCLSIQVLQEFYVTVTRKLPVPVESDVAARIVRDLATWRIHAPDAGDVLEAIELHHRFNISLWDSLIINSATTLGCRVVYSEDLNAGQQYGGVRVVNPFV